MQTHDEISHGATNLADRYLLDTKNDWDQAFRFSSLCCFVDKKLHRGKAAFD